MRSTEENAEMDRAMTGRHTGKFSDYTLTPPDGNQRFVTKSIIRTIWETKITANKELCPP